MTTSFRLTAVVLSIIPCFLVALVLVAWWLRDERIRACIVQLRGLMDKHLDNQSAGLRIEATHPQVAAYRRLAQLLRKEHSADTDH